MKCRDQYVCVYINNAEVFGCYEVDRWINERQEDEYCATEFEKKSYVSFSDDRFCQTCSADKEETLCLKQCLKMYEKTVR